MTFEPINRFDRTISILAGKPLTIVFAAAGMIVWGLLRDSIAIQIKLDELLRAQKNAKNVLFDLEDLSAEDLEHIQRQYASLAIAARAKVQRTHQDGGSPDIDIA